MMVFQGPSSNLGSSVILILCVLTFVYTPFVPFLSFFFFFNLSISPCFLPAKRQLNNIQTYSSLLRTTSLLTWITAEGKCLR